MTLWFLYIFIKSIESFHSLNPSDLSCKKRDYQLITDQSSYILTLDNPLATIHATIGLDNKHISRLLTELWYEQINHQPLTVKSSWHLFKSDGKLNKDHSHFWDFNFSSIINKSDLFFDYKSILNIQSTIFNKPIDLIIRRNYCYYPKTSIDFAICCGLCITIDTCPEIKILHNHSRHNIIVTNRGLIVPRTFKVFHEEFICSLFPSNQTNRFWSTITNSMNIGQIPDKNDLVIIQRTYGMIQNFFYYSLYPFQQWNKQIVNFNFIDVLFIPYKQLAIFELNECDKILLRVYEYKLNKTIQLNSQLYFSEISLEKNICSLTYFHLYFNMLSNMLYLIGKKNIYASDNYGAKLIRIWTDNILLNNSIILDPIMFSDTGHLAFIYQLNNNSSCCYYFAIFSKAGQYYGWRTRTFRSSIVMNEPFFFDSSGSFYFNASPPLLIIQATEQSLVATPHLLVNNIPGPFFVKETDMNRFFVFCSLSLWDNRFELVGSTLQFDKIGQFFIINMDTSISQFAFCLQTSRLDYNPIQTSRQCQLIIHFLKTIKKVHLHLSGCIFNYEDQNSTVITSKFPNIFIDHIFNDTFASGRIFQEIKFNYTDVNQWNIINIQKVEQILDRCLLKNIDSNYHRPSFVYIRPTKIYPIANGDQLVTEHFYFLTHNDYVLHDNKTDNNLYLITSLFDNRKSIIHQEFIRSQLSCYLPSRRTIIFITKCLTNTIIRPKFETNFDLSKLIPIDPPINFQFNRYQAGFNSVIVYNFDHEKNLICDGFKNCSCISSLISHYSIHCAEQFYTMDSTINNRIYMKLWMENEIFYLPNNKSIFLIEELSNRNDYQLIENLWTNEMKEKIVDLFLKDFNQLTDNEIHIFELLNKSLSNGKFIFLGPNLKLELMDEGLYHFRLTYLWGDQFCLTSVDLLIMMISNTATLTSYTFTYFLACIFILIFMIILWMIYVIFYEKIYKKYSKYFFQLKKETFFVPRSINDNINFEMLVKIREQSQRLLPYQHIIFKVDKFKK
ncbi:unnamed protein product [Rotaria sordida]|uniref:Uncharacterized protein n=1 Tax=Rotaria sordida TaxID=392033 RepID=A0A814ZA57_9BILA|nr:unnamed protein product [Rotaria sordida]